MKLGYTILYVDDVPATLAAWEAAFGLERRFLHDSGTYAEVETGATTLSFAEREFGRSHFEGEAASELFDGKAEDGGELACSHGQEDVVGRGQ